MLFIDLGVWFPVVYFSDIYFGMLFFIMITLLICSFSILFNGLLTEGSCPAKSYLRLAKSLAFQKT